MKKIIIMVACALLLITGISSSTFVVGKKKVKTPSIEECVDTLHIVEKVATVLEEIGALQQHCVAHAQAYNNKEAIVCLKTAQQRQEFSLLVSEVEGALDLAIEATKNLNNFIKAQEVKKESDAVAKKAVMQN